MNNYAAKLASYYSTDENPLSQERALQRLCEANGGLTPAELQEKVNRGEPIKEPGDMSWNKDVQKMYVPGNESGYNEAMNLMKKIAGWSPWSSGASNSIDPKNLFFPNAIISPIQGYTFDDITKITEEGGKLTSPFGPRNHPTLGGPDSHGGIDIGAPNGTNILAIEDGRVKYQYTEGYGYQAMIEHKNGIQSFYAHMTEDSYNKYSSLFSKDNIFVKKGDVIGEVGSTGRSTGNHLHFAIRSYSYSNLSVPYIKRDGYYNYNPVKVFRK